MSKSSGESGPKKLENVVVEKTGALSPDDSIQTAGERMRSVDANAWPVVEDSKLVGVIDHPNPDRQAGGHGHDPSTTSVGETMRHDADFCYVDQSACDADRIMQERDLKHLPVVDREMRIVGIISREDVKDAESADGESDWKPGEGHETDSPARESGAEDSRAEDQASEPDEEVDHERFPFRDAPENAETR